MQNKLFIGGLAWTTTEEAMKNFFEQIGEVTEAKIIFDRFKNRSKGFGFVTYASEEDATRAKEELDGKELDGRALKIDFARERE